MYSSSIVSKNSIAVFASLDTFPIASIKWMQVSIEYFPDSTVSEIFFIILFAKSSDPQLILKIVWLATSLSCSLVVVVSRLSI